MAGSYSRLEAVDNCPAPGRAAADSSALDSSELDNSVEDSCPDWAGAPDTLPVGPDQALDTPARSPDSHSSLVDNWDPKAPDQRRPPGVDHLHCATDVAPDPAPPQFRQARKG